MIEAKGTKGKLLKVGADGTIEQVNEKKMEHYLSILLMDML